MRSISTVSRIIPNLTGTNNTWIFEHVLLRRLREFRRFYCGFFDSTWQIFIRYINFVALTLFVDSPSVRLLNYPTALSLPTTTATLYTPSFKFSKKEKKLLFEAL